MCSGRIAPPAVLAVLLQIINVEKDHYWNVNYIKKKQPIAFMKKITLPGFYKLFNFLTCPLPVIQIMDDGVISPSWDQLNVLSVRVQNMLFRFGFRNCGQFSLLSLHLLNPNRKLLPQAQLPFYCEQTGPVSPHFQLAREVPETAQYREINTSAVNWYFEPYSIISVSWV